VDKWFQAHVHRSLDEVAFILSIVIPFLTAMFPPVRTLIRRIVARLALFIGLPQARYRKWFLEEYGTLRNIYLNRMEALSLADTYVSLSVQGDQTSAETRLAASQLFAPSGSRRIILIGDPGTGKSTLLKAYGAGILRPRFRSQPSRDLDDFVHTNEFPIMVVLRQMATYIEDGGSLEAYILELLGKQAKSKDPRRLLHRLLVDGRLVLLLDGLDELPQRSYDQVRTAIHNFVCRDETADMPTSMARVILSCRRQNFFQFRDDWTGWFSDRYFTIAPMQASEIGEFIRRRSDQFLEEKSPESFCVDIQASGTLDLHRVPLVLTISLGLYTQLIGYEIPHSIGGFYGEMLNELLRRHDFRADNHLRMNRFRAEDKLSFLREFALHLARRPTPFADFYYAEVVSYCLKMQPGMARLRHDEVSDFVDEIIDRAGILTSTSDEGHYAYAHRAFQEHLIASQLMREPVSGAEFLLGQATNPEWRQAIILFCGLDNPQASDFIIRLARHAAELACQCLATAVVPNVVAEVLLVRVHEEVIKSQHRPERLLPLLAALVQATHSPREEIRDLAFNALQNELSDLSNSPDTENQRYIFSGLFGGEVPTVAKLLIAMSSRASASVAIAIVNLSRTMPDDEPALVAPLWHSLSIPGVAHTATARSIVRRLLVLVMNPGCFAELQSLPKLTLPWLPDSHRRAAYPLPNGLPLDSNFVTLIGSAYTLKATDEMPASNMYLEALKAPGQPLKYLDRNRSILSRLKVYLVAKVVAYVSMAIAVGCIIASVPELVAGPFSFGTDRFLKTILTSHLVAASIVIGTSWIAQRKYETHGWYGPFSFTAYFIPATEYAAAFELPIKLGLTHRVLRSRSYSISGDVFMMPTALAFSVLYLPLTAIYSIPLVTVLGLPAWLVPIVAGMLIVGTFWLPSTELCGKYSIRSFKASGSFLAIYDDPRSRHWVMPAGANSANVPRQRRRAELEGTRER
jgi:hypothetical protein